MTSVPAPITADPSHLSGLSLGAVTLSVSDLERSLAYYRDAIGLRMLERSALSATLGTDAPLLILHERAGASPARATHTGLYHMALLLPTRADLGRFVAHLIESRVPAQGASDHHVSEALYLQDPDGHGIEVYADRDPSGWTWQGGQVQMGTVAADIQGIVASAGGDPSWHGLPDGTVMGHVHLKVADLERTRAFYAGLLGLDIVVDMARQGALFVSADSYHHHFGLNTWQSRGAAPAPGSEARLLSTQLWLPAAALKALRARLAAGDIEISEVAGGFEVSDPASNRLRFGEKG
ncbi:VOC family protein [Deinococcus sp.]|uniref:VOC family protein n=1 Tax=Deinococcus sp. TaxID=47478 RepID=UPI003CC523AD